MCLPPGATIHKDDSYHYCWKITMHLESIDQFVYTKVWTDTTPVKALIELLYHVWTVYLESGEDVEHCLYDIDRLPDLVIVS